ncbi:MAG: cation transporter [Dorea sp.]|jgi:cation diffusion facilitator family transporter|uniref:cation diffusion facilitator family transporter n=1 Tax=Sporofaciens sp. JLR.KK001 TaxID=3112621 RepID=UPI00216D4EEC|nr:cation transporter [Dorea sp.]
MTEFLVRHFVKEYTEIEKVSVRTAYGVLASVVGIFCNVLLFAVKWTIGYLLHSISVMADAFNNLSDAGSSVIGLVGVKMASKPADQDHPFGHGRIEYIAALIVAFLVMEVGFTFLKDAVGKIRDPEELRFQAVSVVILILSVGVKLWMCFFNRKLGRRIDSKVMLATSADALGDVVTTTATIASVLFFRITGVNIDGIVGLGVSLVVMWAGIGIAKDTLEPLIGEAVEPEEYARIKEFVEGYEGVLGSHDLIVHNYGPGRNMASIHAEVPNDVEIETSHEIIDRIERDAFRMLGVFLVIHMDPVETKDVHVMQVHSQVEQIVKALDPAVSIHDFRMINGEEQVNLIFDMEIPYEYDAKRQDELKTTLIKLLQITDPRYECVITAERSYVASAKE